MKKNKSELIVSFIANLAPLYLGENFHGSYCARSMQDGTVIVPIKVDELDDENNPDAFVKVYWQGDLSRNSEHQGVMLATLSVVRYVELHNAGKSNKEFQTELSSMAHHFTIKTGLSLHLEHDEDESEIVRITQIAIQKLGGEVVIEMLKKAIGL